MNIWLNSIARAAGVEVPAGVEIVPTASRESWLSPLLHAAGKLLCRVGRGLSDAGQRLDRGPSMAPRRFAHHA